MLCDRFPCGFTLAWRSIPDSRQTMVWVIGGGVDNVFQHLPISFKQKTKLTISPTVSSFNPDYCFLFYLHHLKTSTLPIPGASPSFSLIIPITRPALLFLAPLPTPFHPSFCCFHPISSSVFYSPLLPLPLFHRSFSRLFFSVFPSSVFNLFIFFVSLPLPSSPSL